MATLQQQQQQTIEWQSIHKNPLRGLQRCLDVRQIDWKNNRENKRKRVLRIHHQLRTNQQSTHAELKPPQGAIYRMPEPCCRANSS